MLEFSKLSSGTQMLKGNKARKKKKEKGRDLKFDLQIFLVAVVVITDLFWGGNKVQSVVCFCGQVC